MKAQVRDSIPIFLYQMDSLKSNNPEQALKISSQIIDLINNINDPDSIALFYNLRGVCYKNKGKYN